MRDPIDQAYVEAETLLADDATRAARRERVLAAVAGAAAAPARRASPERGRWLIAAGVAGLALIVGSQLYRPFTPPAPTRGGPAARIASASPGGLPQLVTPKPAQVPVVVDQPPEPAVSEPAMKASGDLEAAPPPPPSPPPPRAAENLPSPATASADASSNAVTDVVVTAQKREQSPQRVPVAISAFTGKQRDVAGIKGVEDLGQGPIGPASDQVEAANGSSSVSELVVANDKHAHHHVDPGDELRAAAAAGRTSDLQRLLGRGVDIDDPGPDGDTALIEAIKADKPAAAAFLAQHGASLDAANHAGKTARGLASDARDPKLAKALGLTAPAAPSPP
jgi:hypothetical protein